MNLRDLLRNDFGVDLQISGGTGNSLGNPIIIHRTRLNDYVGTEYTILKFIGLGRRIQWKTIGQESLTHNTRKIDKIKIETKEIKEEQIIDQIENYYFDITECIPGQSDNKSDFNEEETVDKIVER